MSKANHHHGSTGSYVVGYILSLIFTAIPYYMVVHKTVTGNSLLATIIGFAVLQMLIQIFFFLHLGRGPKPLYNVVFFASTVGIILVVVGGSIFIINHLHYNMTPTETTKQVAEDEGISQVEGNKTGSCVSLQATHQVNITNGIAEPAHIDANQCDSLIIFNQDSMTRSITFATPPKEGIYDGVTELNLTKKSGKLVILNQTGTFQYYDHLNPGVTGSFTVAPAQ